MDLFATEQNKKCQQFCSLSRHSPGFLSDAFLLSWTDHLLYAFPPILPVQRVLLKIRRDKAKVVLIAPAWPCQH